MWEKLLYNKKKTKSQEKNNGQINMQLQKYPIEKWPERISHQKNAN